MSQDLIRATGNSHFESGKFPPLATKFPLFKIDQNNVFPGTINRSFQAYKHKTHTRIENSTQTMMPITTNYDTNCHSEILNGLY